MKILPIKLLKIKDGYYKPIIKNPFGFTLIELLIVMAIISSLAALFITSYPASQRKARDTRRRSDLRQYDAILREYAIRNKGYYPGANGTGIEMKCSVHVCITPYFLCDVLGLTGPNCLVDQYNKLPKCYDNEDCVYYYQGSNCSDSTACANSFVLRARLEGEPGWLVYCSNGFTGIVPKDTDWSTNEGFCKFD